MPGWKLPTTFARAGAITTAKSTGVRRGTKISRGDLAVRAKRRRTRVPRAPLRIPREGAAAGRAGEGIETVAMVLSFQSGQQLDMGGWLKRPAVGCRSGGG